MIDLRKYVYPVALDPGKVDEVNSDSDSRRSGPPFEVLGLRRDGKARRVVCRTILEQCNVLLIRLENDDSDYQDPSSFWTNPAMDVGAKRLSSTATRLVCGQLLQDRRMRSRSWQHWWRCHGQAFPQPQAVYTLRAEAIIRTSF